MAEVQEAEDGAGRKALLGLPEVLVSTNAGLGSGERCGMAEIEGAGNAVLAAIGGGGGRGADKPEAANGTGNGQGDSTGPESAEKPGPEQSQQPDRTTDGAQPAEAMPAAQPDNPQSSGFPPHMLPPPPDAAAQMYYAQQMQQPMQAGPPTSDGGMYPPPTQFQMMQMMQAMQQAQYYYYGYGAS